MTKTPLLIKYFMQEKNVGDLASPYLLAKISGRDVTPIPLHTPSEEQHYVGIGSIMSHIDKNSVVWGTGIIKPELLPRTEPLEFLGVRGPHTAALLRDNGHEDVPVIGDAALSMKRFFDPAPKTTHKFGLIPHYVDEQEPLCDICREEGGKVITTQQGLEYYLAELTSCELIISSSLHGLVFAHAYGIPAIWARLSDRVVGDGFKFRDYYAFMGRDADQIPIWDPEASFADNLAKADCPDIPEVSKTAPDLLYDDLVKRGHI